ncbi:MAG: hypothetical protein Q9207_005302 [Kuettlingeria erythrocarpa]
MYDYVCPDCEVILATWQQLHNHQRDHDHSFCWECHQACAGRAKLRQHTREKHTKNCEVCTRGFGTWAELQVHQRETGHCLKGECLRYLDTYIGCGRADEWLGRPAGGMKSDYSHTMPAEPKRKREDVEEGEVEEEAAANTKKKRVEKEETLLGPNVIDLTEIDVPYEKDEAWKEYACYQCQGTFDTGEELGLHQRFEHERDDNDSACHDCGCTFAVQEELAMHVFYDHRPDSESE